MTGLTVRVCRMQFINGIYVGIDDVDEDASAIDQLILTIQSLL